MALQKAPWMFDQEGHCYGWLYGWIWTEINNPTFQWYATSLQSFFLPHFVGMGLPVFILEIAVGFSLLTDTSVPLVGGLLGTALQINLLLGNYSVPGEWFWTYPLLIVSHLALLMGRAGRVFGVDALLAPRFAGREEHAGVIERLLLHAV